MCVLKRDTHPHYDVDMYVSDNRCLGGFVSCGT